MTLVFPNRNPTIQPMMNMPAIKMIRDIWSVQKKRRILTTSVFWATKITDKTNRMRATRSFGFTVSSFSFYKS